MGALVTVGGGGTRTVDVGRDCTLSVGYTRAMGRGRILYRQKFETLHRPSSVAVVATGPACMIIFKSQPMLVVKTLVV